MSDDDCGEDYQMLLLHELGVDEDMIHEMNLVKILSTNAVIYIRKTDLDRITDVTKEKIIDIIEDIHRNCCWRLPTMMSMDEEGVEVYVQPRSG